MASAQYRIECDHPLYHQLLPLGGRLPLELADRELAVSLAAKNFEAASGQEIRVVHIPTGEIVFRKDGDQGAFGVRSVRLKSTTGINPTSTRASEGNAASPSRSSRASW